jgi:hypothetical protein
MAVADWSVEKTAAARNPLRVADPDQSAELDEEDSDEMFKALLADLMERGDLLQHAAMPMYAVFVHQAHCL